MRNFILLLTYCILILASCDMDCVTKKTGIYKSSQTIEEAKETGVFQFQMFSDKQSLKIDHNRILKIKNAWVENCWVYDCIDNRAVLRKSDTLQFIIDDEYKCPEADTIHYVLSLWENKNIWGNVLGGMLRFHYAGQDTITLVLTTSDKVEGEYKMLDTLKFCKMK